MAQVQLASAELGLTVVIGLEILSEKSLKSGSKPCAFGVCRGVEHLRALELWVGVGVLMNGNADRVGIFIEQLQTVFHIGYLLSADALHAAVMNGHIAVAGGDGGVAEYLRHIADSQHDIQIDALFGDTVRSGAASVHAAVWCVCLNCSFCLLLYFPINGNLAVFTCLVFTYVNSIYKVINYFSGQLVNIKVLVNNSLFVGFL